MPREKSAKKQKQDKQKWIITNLSSPRKNATSINKQKVDHSLIKSSSCLDIRMTQSFLYLPLHFSLFLRYFSQALNSVSLSFSPVSLLFTVDKPDVVLMATLQTLLLVNCWSRFRIKLNWQVVRAWLVCDIYNLHALFDILPVQLCQLGNKNDAHDVLPFSTHQDTTQPALMRMKWRRRKATDEQRSWGAPERDGCAVVIIVLLSA